MAIIWVHTIWPRINVSRGWRYVVAVSNGSTHVYTHVWRNPCTHRAPRRFILQHTHHAVPRALRDLQTAAVRPSINLFNPIIRIRLRSSSIAHRWRRSRAVVILGWASTPQTLRMVHTLGTVRIYKAAFAPTPRSFTSKWTWQGRLYRNVHYSEMARKKKGW